MFGFIRKKELIERMKEVKDGNRFSNLFVKQEKSEEQIMKNLYSQGFNDGMDNFYHALVGFVNYN